MREMVLNHASLTAPNQHAALNWLRELVPGMTQLIQDGVVPHTLRMVCPPQQIACTSDQSLFETYLLLGQQGAREEHRFFMRLADRYPIWEGVDQDVKDRFLGCEEKTLPAEDAEPLLFCAIADGISVGFPSDSAWEHDTIVVCFSELLPDGTFEEASETIDNLTRSDHAQPICERHWSGLRKFKDFESLWNLRERAFPNLRFDPSVKRQLDGLDSAAMSKVLTALARMEIGNLSDVKSVGTGVSELRLHYGPGYRIYFADDVSTLVVLSCGTKQSQNQDIQTARRLWQTYKRSERKGHL